MNKLRTEPIRSAPNYVGALSSRPGTARTTTHQTTETNTNYLPTPIRTPLPAELITKRTTNSFASTILPQHNRTSTPFVLTKNENKTNDNGNVRIPTPLRASTKTLDIGLRQLDRFNFDQVTIDEHQQQSTVNIEKNKNKFFFDNVF